MKPLFKIPGYRQRASFGTRMARLFFIGLLCVVGYLALFALAALMARYPEPTALPPGVARGVYHVHSTASDGKGTLEQIARAAAETGNSFVIVTDHNIDSPPPAAYVEGVLVIQSNELTTPAGHLVALGASRGLTPDERQTAPLSKVTELGGFSVLAHPVQERNPWRDWSAARRSAGLELYSADTMFRQALVNPLFRLAPALGAYGVHRKHALMTLVQPEPQAHARLLKLGGDAPKIALCSVDAHGLPSYQDVFSTLGTYVPLSQPLPQDAPEAAKIILGALQRGQTYCVFRHLGDGAGFGMGATGELVHQAKVGDRIKIRLPPTVTLPTRVQIFGPAQLEADGTTVVLQRPGSVQIEVWALAPGRFLRSEWKPWLVPSPLWVFDGDSDRVETDMAAPPARPADSAPPAP